MACHTRFSVDTGVSNSLIFGAEFGVVGLGPGVAGRLLRQCRGVKVKRLFHRFAKRHGHAWFDRLDLEGVDLGSGERMPVRGRRLVRAIVIEATTMG